MSPLVIVALVVLGLGAVLAASTLAVMGLTSDSSTGPTVSAGRPVPAESTSRAPARLRGRVVSFSGLTLVVRGKGTDVSVTVRSDTPFGNKANPAARADVKPGVVVVVVGPTEDPERILVPDSGAGSAPSASPTPSG